MSSTEEKFSLGDNIDAQIKKNILILKIDLKKHIGLSKSGKSNVIATTRGNKALPSDIKVKVGINIYKAVVPLSE